MSALRLDGVTLRLGSGDAQVTALDDVSVTVGAGELLAVVGPSGSGKSSLLAVAGALIRPASGQVHVAGNNLADLSDRALARLRRTRLGYLFQAANLLPALTVREQLLLARRLDRRIDAAARSRAGELLDAVGMAHRANHRPHQLSGGERQRVGLARALMNEPAVLLVDEPTAALDRERGRQVVALIADRVHGSETACVLVTHDEDAAARADRVLAMRDGRLRSVSDRAE